MRKNLKTLLSAAVASAMMLTSVSVTSFAATSVSTLEALQQAIADGETAITVTQALTITGNVTLKAASDVSITTTGVTDVFTVTSGGNLTLGNNIPVESNRSILYANGGTITVDGAEISNTADANYNLGCAQNDGTINVKSGTITGNNGDRATLSIDSGSTAEISGGKVISTGSSVIAAKGGSTVTVSGNAVVETTVTTLPRVAIFTEGSDSKIIVNGGTIKSASEAAVDANEGGSVTITDGTITSPTGIDAVTTSGTGTASVSGGSFSSDVSEYLEEGLEQDDEGNVVENVIDTEAELRAAIANGGEVVIGGDIPLSAAITISNTVTLKSDSDVTVTANGVTDVFTVTSGGNLTLGNNISVESNTSILYANGGTITVDGAELNSENSIYALGYANDSGVINVVSGTVSCSGDKVTLDIDDGSTATISGGTVFSKDSSAIAVRNGSTVTVGGDATVETTASSALAAIFTYDANSKVIVNGGTIKSANDAAVDANEGGSVTITDGTLTGGTGVDAVTTSGTGTASVSGGSFSSDLPDEYIVPTDKTLVKNETTGLWELGTLAVTSIAITTAPTKTTYTAGDELDLTGIVITATYNDETTATVSSDDVTVTGFDSEAAGTQTITVTYEGKTATFEVTVEAAAEEEPIVTTTTTEAPTTTPDEDVTTTTTTEAPTTTPDEDVTTTTTTQAPVTSPVVVPSYTGTRPSSSAVTTTTTTTNTTTTTPPAEEDEEIEDDIEIEEDDDVEIEEDTDTTQPAEDDYEDDDTDEEVDADVETPADGSSDGNPITGVAISFAGVIASAAAVMLAKKRK